MWRTVVAASAVFALFSGTLSAFLILKDRQDAMHHVEEHTASMARMITAHSDAALDAAESIVTHISPLVTQWDFRNEQQGRSIFAKLRELLEGNPLLSSAWIMDATGTIHIDTWSYPGNLIDGASRPHLQAHLAGAASPVILSGDRPGTNSGKQRITFSHALHDPDGSLKAVAVVAIYRGNFDTLYSEAANWDGAWAGLQTMEAVSLARFEQTESDYPEFLQLLTQHVRGADTGSVILGTGADKRLVSWKRSSSHPQVYGSSSQTIPEALTSWRKRSWTIVLLTLAVNLAFMAYVSYAHRANHAEQAARANELAVREVNHRIKNSLQIISTLIQMRARKTEDVGYQEAAKDAVSHLSAVAHIYSFVQSSTSLDNVDLSETLKGLCAHLHDSYDATVELIAPRPIHVDANRAATLAVVVNELATNAIKHGDGKVKVSCRQDQNTLRIAVSNSGSMLPDGFSLDTSKGFGLKAVNAMVSGLGGKLTAESIMTGGAIFDVAIPMSALHH